MSTTNGAAAKTNRSALRGKMSSFCRNLPTFGQQLQRAERTGLHRAEAALHERHQLEQVQVHQGARDEQHRGEAGADTDTGLLPVRELPQDRDVGHLSMSPRMK
jgi:hypothetical protein